MPSIPRPPAAVTFDCWKTLLVERDWERAHALRVESLVWAAREAGRQPSLVEATAASAPPGRATWTPGTTGG